jgi:archaellum component FlaG (FlaF/FlaG flagellin family)
MDKVLSTILLVIASLVCVVLAINVIYPATSISSSALSSISVQMGDRIRSQMAIVHATGELDQDEVWQDTNSDSEFDIFVWVKNIGATTLDNPENCDLFVESDGIITRIPHEDWAGGSLPSWDYTIENGTDWGQETTIMIEISYESALSAGDYSIKLIIPNGISDEYYFSM